MSADAPTPYIPPDGVIVTTMADARRVGHGQVAHSVYSDPKHVRRRAVSEEWADAAALVWWRPVPERMILVGFPASVARKISQGTAGWDPTIKAEIFYRVEAAVMDDARTPDWPSVTDLDAET